jgi:hypothetical protein
MTTRSDLIINMHTAEAHEELSGARFGSIYKVLTTMERSGRLGVNLSRVPPGRTACPFHAHQLEDEVFIIHQKHSIRIRRQAGQGPTMRPTRPSPDARHARSYLPDAPWTGRGGSWH